MLELSVEFFPPKTGEGISRFNKAADELVPLASALRLLLMAQEVPLGKAP